MLDAPRLLLFVVLGALSTCKEAFCQQFLAKQAAEKKNRQTKHAEQFNLIEIHFWLLLGVLGFVFLFWHMLVAS